MNKIVDPHSGKKKFFKGRGRTGKTQLDEYQKMLLEQEELNKLEKHGIIKQERQPKPRKKSL